jgi:uncharacterized protein (DUF1800 family)
VPTAPTVPTVPVPARRAFLAVIGAGLAAGCTAPAISRTTKAAGPKPAAIPKATAKPVTAPVTKAPVTKAPVSTTPTTPATSAPPTSTPSATVTPTATPTVTPTVTPNLVVTPGVVLPNLVGTDPAWHLLRRATFGPTPALVAEVKTIGTTAWLNQQLNPASIDDSACDAYLTRYPTVSMTTVQIRASIQQYSWDAMSQLVRATLARALWSKRQLLEVMTEFWSNHFNILTPNGDAWDLKTVDDREVIRKNALGSFSDMLLASAQSPAMMRYLSLATSTVDSLNENYGRELLELHTVGIDAGYTHDDVINSARIMTGYTEGVHGEFAYRNDWHYVGPVKVLNFTDPNADEFAGLTLIPRYLKYLATHPSTARHLATKLAIRFVSDTPSAALIDSLASVYLANDTAIAPVLRALFTSAEFGASIAQKTRRPMEDLIAASRMMGVAPAAGDANSLGSLYWLLGTLGQAPFGWHPPDGYPDVAGAWLSAGGMLRRWNGHASVTGGWMQDGMSTPAVTTLLPAPAPATIGALVDSLSTRLLGTKLTGTQRSAVIAFAGYRNTAKYTENYSSADNIKWDLVPIVTLILNTPNWIQR